MLLGAANGTVYHEQDLHNDDTVPIQCIVGTFEWDGGDLRAQGNFGDLYLDCVPQSEILAQPVALSSALGSATPIGPSTSRTFAPIDFTGGQTTQKYLGLYLIWTDDFTEISSPTLLHLWQAAVIPQPVIEQSRIHDWMGGNGALYYRGFVLSADTFNVVKGLAVRDADTLTIQPFGGPAGANQIQFDGQDEQAFFFPVPFVSHYVRLEPTDAKPWRYFGPPYGQGVLWVADQWPELNQDDSPWFNMGTTGAKYLMGAVFPLDTNGEAVTLTLLSSDGGTRSIGPFTTTAVEKTSVAFKLDVPLIGHQFQLLKSAPCRIWWDEMLWNFEPWPELTADSSPWMNLGTPGAKYMRGAVIPMDTAGADITLTLYSSDGGSVSMGPFNSTLSEKSPEPWAFSIPLVGHEFQLAKSGPCRIWLNEIRWDFDA